MHRFWPQLGHRAAERGWMFEGNVRSIAGALVLISIALSLWDRHWLLLSAFVGLNLLQSGLSGWCLMSNLLALARHGRPAER